MADWRDTLTLKSEEIVVSGGELRFVVIKRGNERIPEIYSYPDNKIRCETEVLK